MRGMLFLDIKKLNRHVLFLNYVSMLKYNNKKNSEIIHQRNVYVFDFYKPINHRRKNIYNKIPKLFIYYETHRRGKIKYK